MVHDILIEGLAVSFVHKLLGVGVPAHGDFQYLIASANLFGRYEMQIIRLYLCTLGMQTDGAFLVETLGPARVWFHKKNSTTKILFCQVLFFHRLLTMLCTAYSPSR